MKLGSNDNNSILIWHPHSDLKGVRKVSEMYQQYLFMETKIATRPFTNYGGNS